LSIFRVSTEKIQVSFIFKGPVWYLNFRIWFTKNVLFGKDKILK